MLFKIYIERDGLGCWLKAMPRDNDLRNDIVKDATSMMEFNDCNDIVKC